MRPFSRDPRREERDGLDGGLDLVAGPLREPGCVMRLERRAARNRAAFGIDRFAVLGEQRGDRRGVLVLERPGERGDRRPDRLLVLGSTGRLGGRRAGTSRPGTVLLRTVRGAQRYDRESHTEDRHVGSTHFRMPLCLFLARLVIHHPPGP